MSGDTYEQLRTQWKPDQVRLLLIGESAPDPRSRELRFFYAPTLSQHDNLFRGVILALYGCTPGTAGDPKRPWLQRLKDDGVFLIDLVPFPVNALGSRERKQTLCDHAEQCVAAAAALQPQGIAVCHGPTFQALRPGLEQAALPLLHDDPLPFPLGNWREQFAAGLRAAASAAGLRFSQPG